MKNFYKGLLGCALLLSSSAIFAQVGIGTVNPNAQLTIDSGTTDLAPIELTPMAAAPGTSLNGGQMVVINNELYLYDTTRSHFLSVSTSQLAFTRNGNADDTNLYFGGRITNQNSGAVMPFDGTIVHVSGISAGGSATKEFELRVRSGGATINNQTINLAANAYNDTTTDIDFSAGDVIVMRVIDDGTGTVNNPAFTVWVKWRQ